MEDSGAPLPRNEVDAEHLKTSNHQNERHTCRPDQTSFWKLLLEVAAVGVGASVALIYLFQLSAMRGQLDQMVGSSGQTDQLLGLYRRQLDQLKIQTGATKLLAEAAQTQADASKISARAAESAAKTAKATLDAQSSPWLGMEKDEADFIPPRSYGRNGNIDLTFTIPLHNYGSRPALDVSVYISPKTDGEKYIGPLFFLNSNVCAEPEQAQRDVQARKFYGVEHIVWPSGDWTSRHTISIGRSSASYISGCISYRGHSDSFKHIKFFYVVHARYNPGDPPSASPEVYDVTLVGLDPFE